MPEGDTIFRAARTLNRALAGKTVTRFEAAFPKLTRVHEDAPIVGRTIESVSARGKHILMMFGPSTRFARPGEAASPVARSGRAPFSRVARSDEGLVLRTHMRMNGSWHIYRPQERWQRPRSDMRIVIATSDFVAVGFNIPVAEWLDTTALSRHDDLRRLGPDLLGADFDAEEALARLRRRSTEPIASALLNQRVMAGIGNVYKSEVLFACRVNPFVAVADLGDEQLRCIIATARKFLQANITEGLAAMTTYMGFRRTTRRDAPSERLWVYGRAGEPCRRCGAAIEIDKRGADARLTYWCGTCQR